MKRFILISIACLALPATGFAQFGKFTKVFDKAKTISDMQISEEDERALGQAISERIRAIYGVQQDEGPTRYVTLVGLVLAGKSSRSKLDWQFIILDSDSTNAFATPGGFIHITRGALAMMKDESDLAGVLAHEISHVTEKHTVKGIQKMKGIEFASDESSITANSQVFEMIADKATEALLQGFGRSEELESDKDGVELAADCGYAPSGLPDFLESLSARYESRENRAGLFASHPETTERIEKLRKQIENEKLGGKGTAELPDRFTAHIKYKLSAFTGTGQAVEGAMGMAQGESKGKDDEKESDKKGDKKDDGGGGALAKLKNPFGSGKKQERAEVTGSAAARGVETEVGVEEPGNPAPVVVKVTAEELKTFKAEGGLA